jgi:site-specific DNA recombinase
MEKLKRVVGYARVSTEAQDITRQIALIKTFCAERNYHLVKIIQEKISGAKRDRKSINELMEVDDTTADMIVVSELSRFSREEEIMPVLTNINDLLKQGVDIIFLDKPERTYRAGESLDLISIITLAVEARASADERMKITGRMQTGLRTKLTEFSDMFVGGIIPFGYKVIPNPDYKLNVTPKNNLIVDEKKVNAVRYLFQQLVDGKTIRKTVRVYNELFPYKLTYMPL